MGSHLIDGRFQSDKYPTTPRGKVPLSTKDPLVQDLLWETARRYEGVDAEFSEDLRAALKNDGYQAQRATSFEVDEERARTLSSETTGIFVRAKKGPRFGSFDIAVLTAKSLLAWLRSRGGVNAWAESVVFTMLGHSAEAHAAAMAELGKK